MDANGLRFWMLNRRADWPWTAGTQGLQYCDARGRLQLLSAGTAPPPAEDAALAALQVERTPPARDRFGGYARYDAGSGRIVAGGNGPGEIAIATLPAGASCSDLALGHDGILYVAVAGTLVLVDRRGRWPDFTLAVPDFTFWRLAALPGGGVLALDRAHAQLGTVAGSPLRAEPLAPSPPGLLRPCDPNPSPPRLTTICPLPGGETYVALAETGDGTAAVLSWATAAGDDVAQLRSYAPPGTLGAPVRLGGVRRPYAIAWLGDARIAAFATHAKEALVFDRSVASDALVPAGDTYVLRGETAGPFAHGFDQPPSYANAADGPAALFPLLPLSLQTFAAGGRTDPLAPAVFDSGTAQTVWHRLFLEAVVPPRCGMIVWLAATGAPAELTSPLTRWYPHVVGAADTSAIAPDLLPDVPRAVWQSATPEVAFAPDLLGAEPLRDRQGLFMVLLQRAGKAVRALQGRYLGVRLEMNGDRRTTPELAALRAYGSRFSYVNQYLPEIYREDTFGAAADRDGESTRRDFFERFTCGFEAQLTRIEDRVASAYLLTRAEAAPDAALDWLGGWIGIEPSGYPPDRRRARIEATPDLYRQRGTASGLALAIDVATGGLCASGAIVVIEDFRLRHTFATILGADLSIKADPLLPGYAGSSNSIVGDTLFLGDPHVQDELQALYATDLGLPDGAADAAALYDALANRVSVFLHDRVERVDAALVTRIVEREKPAHVAASVRRASQGLMIGLASLLGVNTYLGAAARPGSVALDASEVGRYDVVTNLPSLDPRLELGTRAGTARGR